jgi:hypothetical protein
MHQNSPIANWRGSGIIVGLFMDLVTNYPEYMNNKTNFVAIAGNITRGAKLLARV